jgi:preprotein translocase SecE subunit
MSDTQAAAEELAPKTLGLLRWVQLAYMALFVTLLWLLDKVVTIVWDKFAEPQPVLVTLVAAGVAAAITLVCYRHPTASRVSNEIVGELAKVTWPSRDEIQTATVVVIITSVIASLIIGAFDAIWSTPTDLIYKV